MSARHILFVETEGTALQTLMRSLTGTHDDWQIVRVAETDAALDILSQRVFSVLIASLGNEHAQCDTFLRQIQTRAPAVIRFALLPESREGDAPPILESACQCFPVECASTELTAAIRRGIRVWQRCRENTGLTNLLSDLHTLPTPPRLYFEIRDELDSATSDARSVAQILARDPALTAKLLKIANSGFYALPRTVTDIRDAVTFLGTDMVTSLVLATHVFDRMPAPGVNLDAVWKHSLTASALARHVAAQEGGDRLTITTAGIAGLLHDIGQLVLLANAPDVYYPMLRRAGGDENALLDMELDQFGASHAELGSHLLALWSLPEAVVEAVALHHDCSRYATQTVALTSKAVYVAEWFLQESALHDESGRSGDLEGCLDSPRGKIRDWREACAQLMAKSA
jgi:putative nucleotidyltransferase with HDIG domain